MDSLHIRWRALTGTRTPQELYGLFDLDNNGFITFKELFPDMKKRSTETRSISTPDWWSRWCRSTSNTGKLRDPCWQTGSEPPLETLLDEVRARDDATDNRAWMSATFRRLKHNGKSDARCREVCARHLPKGTGPKDREDVPTFSEQQLKSCKKSYSEHVNGPVRNIQKTVFEMRSTRRELQTSKQSLGSVIQRPGAADIDQAPGMGRRGSNCNLQSMDPALSKFFKSRVTMFASDDGDAAK